MVRELSKFSRALLLVKQSAAQDVEIILPVRHASSCVDLARAGSACARHGAELVRCKSSHHVYAVP